MQKEFEMLNKYDDILTFKELMNILKIGRTKAYMLLKNKTIKSIKVGSQYRISKTQIIEYLNQT